MREEEILAALFDIGRQAGLVPNKLPEPSRVDPALMTMAWVHDPAPGHWDINIEIVYNNGSSVGAESQTISGAIERAYELLKLGPDAAESTGPIG